MLDQEYISQKEYDEAMKDKVYDRIQGQFIVANYLLASHTRVQQESASGDHEMVLDALRAGDFSRAHSIIEEHIQGACQKILIKMHA